MNNLLKQNRLDFISNKIDQLTLEIDSLSNVQKTLFDYRADLEKEVFYTITGISKGDIVLYKPNKNDKPIEGLFSGLTNSIKHLYSFSLIKDNKVIYEGKIQIKKEVFDSFYKTNLKSK